MEEQLHNCTISIWTHHFTIAQSLYGRTIAQGPIAQDNLYIDPSIGRTIAPQCDLYGPLQKQCCISIGKPCQGLFRVRRIVALTFAKEWCWTGTTHARAHPRPLDVLMSFPPLHRMCERVLWCILSSGKNSPRTPLGNNQEVRQQGWGLSFSRLLSPPLPPLATTVDRIVGDYDLWLLCTKHHCINPPKSKIR